MMKMFRLPVYDWGHLEREAVTVVESSIESFPSEVKRLADRLPVIYRNWHPDALEGDPEAIELLGEYLSFEEDRLGEENGPIVLYLGAIQLYCEEEGIAFREEVRVTYLHELGHHFGWDEDELEERGLG